MFGIPTRTFLLLFLDALLLAGSLYQTSYLLTRPRAPYDLEGHGESIVVSRVLDHSSASGLSLGDTVVTVSGIPVRSPHDPEVHADRRVIGEELPMTVVRDGRIRAIRPLLIPFFSVTYVVISLLIGLVTLAVAVFVILVRPGDRTASAVHAPLACMAFSVMLMWGSTPSGDLWPPISRALYFVTYLGTGITFHRFTLLFPRPVNERAGRSVAPYILPFIVMLVATILHLEAIQEDSTAKYQFFRVTFDLYHITLLIYVALGIRNLAVAYGATSAPDIRKQLQWVFWGVTIGPAPFLLLEVVPELLISVSPIPEELTLVFLLAIPASFAISLLRYHLFDVQVVIRRTTVYAVVIGGLVITYLALAALATWLVGSQSVVTSTIAALVVALGFDTVRRRVQMFVDRKFFRVRYSFREAERRCVEEMKRCGDARSIGALMVEEVQRLMPASGVSFCLTDSSNGRWITIAESPPGWRIRDNDHPGDIVLQGFPAVPLALPRWIEPGVDYLRADEDAFSRRGVAVAVPMATRDGRPIGLMVLGKKLSEVRYSREDIDLLVNLTTHAGLEVDRIRLQRMIFRQEVETARLQELNQLKSEFVDSVTHEFKIPLTGIILFAESLGDHLGGRDRKVREGVEIIDGQARRLNRMVTSILDIGRIERGEKEFAKARNDLGLLVLKSCREMRYPLESLGFALRIVGAGGKRRFPILADEDAVVEAVTNIIENAIKYSGTSRRIVVGCSRRGDSVFCSVRDWGIGISTESIPRIFEKHFRDPAGGSIAEGFGIGLSVVEEIMRAHEGRVEVKSAPGRGSTFTLVFPLDGSSSR